MERNLLIGGDFGTNGLKLLAFDAQRDQVVASAYRSYPVHIPGPNLAEHDPEDWWTAFTGCLAELWSQGVCASAVAALALSCHCPTLLPVDEKGEILGNGIIWADYRSTPQCRQLRAEHGAFLHGVNPTELQSHQMLPKILWLKQTHPQLYAQTVSFLQCSGYIVWRLTGRLSVDHGNAAIYHVYNVDNGRWDAEACRRLGVDINKLPPLYGSDEPVGTVLPEIAAQTGLDPETLVVAGTGDTPAAALGIGCLQEGDICFSAGTAASMVTVYDCSEKPFRTDPRLLTIGHTLERSMLNVAVLSGVGAALKWAKNALGGQESQQAADTGADVFDLLTAQAAQASPGSGGVLFFPYMLGVLSPYFNPDARGAFLGISEATGKPELLRAVLEGTCYAFRQNLDILKELGAFYGQGEIIATGGPASSPLWMQILADVSGLRVSVLDNTLGAPFGDVILAGVGAGIYPDQATAARAHLCRSRTYEPVAENRAVYDRMFEAYDRISLHLQQDFEILSQAREKEV